MPRSSYSSRAARTICSRLASAASAFDIATSLADTVSTYASMVYVKGLCSNEQF